MLNVPGAILLCGIQIACKGNEADGVIYFDLDGEIEIPCCSECAAQLQAMSEGE